MANLNKRHEAMGLGIFEEQQAEVKKDGEWLSLISAAMTYTMTLRMSFTLKTSLP
jgi:hypothetical protein